MRLSLLNHFWAPIAVVLLFSSTLVGIDRLAFRDVSHFYTPLYDHIATRTSETWLPMWNDRDQMGMPLVGESTTAVFYPFRAIVYQLPVSSPMACYVVLHLVLASLAATWAATCAGVGKEWATIAGTLYPLSAAVLFLYTNPPFLVGAAWLPILFASVIATEAGSWRFRSWVSGFAMAMMILGGDPQSALHVCLIAVLIAIARLVRKSPKFAAFDFLKVLVLGALIACALSAPQLMASLSWSRQSERALAIETAAWHQPPRSGSQRDASYQFSLPPWHVAELLVPNASGTPLPENHRVSRLVLGDGRMWTPSVYCGMLGAFAIISSLIRLRRTRMDAWTGTAVVALLLSMGHFGVVWLVQQIPGVLPNTDSAIGGPYWFLYQFVPGYDAFRYPAKWLPVASLAIAVSSAMFVQRIAKNPRETTNTKEMKAVTLIIAVLLVVGWCATWILSLRLDGINVPSDDYFGPLGAQSGLSEVRWSIFHGAVALAVVYLLLCFLNSSSAFSRFAMTGLTLFVAMEMAFASHGNIATANRQVERDATKDQFVKTEPTRCFLRTQSQGQWPQTWEDTRSPNRLDEVAAGERIAWWGRWHLVQSDARLLNSVVSIRSHDLTTFWNAMSLQRESLSEDEFAKLWRAVYTWLEITDQLDTSGKQNQIRGLTLPTIRQSSIGDSIGSDKPVVMDSWNEGDAEYSTLDQLDLVFRELLSDSHKPSIFDCDSVCSDPGWLRDHSADKLVVAKTQREQLIVRSVYQDGHWRAKVTNRETNESQWLSVYKVDFLKQGVVLGPGDWDITFVYAPVWLGPACLIALLGWFAWIVCAVRWLTQRSA